MSHGIMNEEQLECSEPDCDGLLLVTQEYTGWRTMYADGYVQRSPDGLNVIMVDPNSWGNDDVNTDENNQVNGNTLLCTHCNKEYRFTYIDEEAN